MDHIFRGTTEKCLMHFRDAPFDGNKREALGAFCKVSVDNTVRKWFSRNNPSSPAGETLVRVRYYLEHIGYKVTELEELDPVIYRVGQIYAFGAVDLEYLVNRFDTKTRSQLLTIFHGGRGISAERRRRFAAFAEEHAKNLAGAVKTALASHPRGNLVGDAKTQPKPPAAPSASRGGDDMVVESAAGAIHGLLPLMRFMTSPSSSPELRDKFRKMVGAAPLFEGSNLLGRLCSETAFKLHQK